MPGLHSFGKLHVRAYFLVGALAVLSMAGCGKNGNSVSVQGHVSYHGEAVTPGTVTFFPETGRQVVAPLSGEGEYEAELAPGEYVVTVMVGATVPPGYKEGDPLPPPKVVLPTEYMSRLKSSLKASVKEGQAAPIDFELK